MRGWRLERAADGRVGARERPGGLKEAWAEGGEHIDAVRVGGLNCGSGEVVKKYY